MTQILTFIGFIVVFLSGLWLCSWLIFLLVSHFLDATVFLKSWLDYNRNRKEFKQWREENKKLTKNSK